MKTAITALALIAAGIPGAAMAGKNEDAARYAIGQAQGKIEAGDRIGVARNAADVQVRARAALAEADREFRRGHEGVARSAALEADALADLALATSEYRRRVGR